MSVAANVLEMIGNTPMIELQGLDTGPCRLFAKLENQNPAGSIKDRIGLSMIEAAEKDGRLKPGGLMVEATAGNTGLGLALVAGHKGYRLMIVLPDKMSQEKVFHLRAMGAEIVMTRSDVGKGHPEYYQDLGKRLAEERQAWFVNQFENPANPQAHEEGTGPEIWGQMDGDVDAVVCGVGSGGTITGLSRYFERTAPELDMVLADPKGSIVAHYVRTGEVIEPTGSWQVEGIGEDFVPPVSDLSRVKHAYEVTDGEAFETARSLLQTNGVFAGSSSGTLIHAAMQYCREQTAPKKVVTFVCDSGNKYLSKMYNDYWMLDQGYMARESHGDLRDLIARRHKEHAVVTVGPDEPIMTAYTRMKLADVSQLPVVEKDRVIGLIDESDILLSVYHHEARFEDPVRSAMSKNLETLPPGAPVRMLMPVFDKGFVVIVEDESGFLGLITAIDLLNYLRRQMK